MTKTLDKFKGCMLGLAIGDSCGYPVEFIRSREDILTVTGGKGVTGPPDPAIYTDDTQMTISIAQALIDAGSDMDSFMDALTKEFLAWYELQNDPEHRRAPGNTCLSACEHLRCGVHWESAGIPVSLGCGSAMRSAPIGLYHTQVEKVVDYAISSSKITHPAELTLCASVGNAYVTYLAHHGEPVGCWANELVKICSINNEFKACIKEAASAAAERADPDFVLSEKCLGEGWMGHEAIASAIYCCMMHPDSYEKATLLAANAVGDSDSIACIVGGWMGARLGTEGIPADWRDKIEGKEKLLKLAEQLHRGTGQDEQPASKSPSPEASETADCSKSRSDPTMV